MYEWKGRDGEWEVKSLVIQRGDKKHMVSKESVEEYKVKGPAFPMEAESIVMPY